MRSVLVFCLAVAGLSAQAQIPGNPVGPRLGTVLELDVDLPGPGALALLGEAGYNIGHFSDPSRVTIYATPEERDRLMADGYTVREVARQPAPPEFDEGAKGLGVYHSYTSLTNELLAYAGDHPAIARLVTLGASVSNRQLWALLITDNPDEEEDEPEFKYVSTMHGDEPVGTEMCHYLIDRLLTAYGTDSRVTDLVNETEIWIVPLMNPDGLESGSRFNANGIDLNRAFPDFPVDYVGTFHDGDPLDDAGRQPEVARILRWTADRRFVLSANFHTGAVVVNYLYDHIPGIPTGVDAPTPDNALIRALSLEYSTHNPPMFASLTFPNGVSNGSEWYSITGGMQDWHYRYMGCIDATIELAVPKKPSQSLLPIYWANNEESMLSYLEAVHRGIRGIVTDADTGLPLDARITIQGNLQPVFTDPDVGDYYRLLLPGAYTVVVEVPGYFTQTIPGVVVSAGSATRVDVEMNVIPLPAARPIALVLTGVSLVAAAGLIRRKRWRANRG